MLCPILGSMRISYADSAGNYIVIENKSSTSHNIIGWSRTQMVVGAKNGAVYDLPQHCRLEPRSSFCMFCREMEAGNSLIPVHLIEG